MQEKYSFILKIGRFKLLLNFYKEEITLKHPKNKNITKVPMSKNYMKALENYQFAFGLKNGHVFLSNRGRPLSDSAFNQVIHKWVRKAYLDDTRITSHTFRHTFITKLINLNVPEEKIIQYTGATKEALRSCIHKRKYDKIGI